MMMVRQDMNNSCHSSVSDWFGLVLVVGLRQRREKTRSNLNSKTNQDQIIQNISISLFTTIPQLLPSTKISLQQLICSMNDIIYLLIYI